MSMFERQVKGLMEDIDYKRATAIRQLDRHDFEEHNPEAFQQSLSSSKHPDMLSKYPNEELNKMKLFKVKGKNIGFALKKREGQTKHDELVLVHNNEEGVKGIGDHLVQAAIRHGATHLDNYDGMLTDLYARNGFKEYDRAPFDPQYDEGGKFEKKYGKRDVVYMKRDEGLKEDVRQSGFKSLIEGFLLA